MFTVHASSENIRVERFECTDARTAAEHCLELYVSGYVLHRVVTPRGQTVNGGDLHAMLRALPVRAKDDLHGVASIERIQQCLVQANGDGSA